MIHGEAVVGSIEGFWLIRCQADSKWMKNKKRKTGEEIKEHKRRAKASKVGRASGRGRARGADLIMSRKSISLPRRSVLLR